MKYGHFNESTAIVHTSADVLLLLMQHLTLD